MHQPEILIQERLFAVAEPVDSEHTECNLCLGAVAKKLDGMPISDVTPEQVAQLLAFTAEGEDGQGLIEMDNGAILECARQGCTAGSVVLVFAGHLETNFVAAGYSSLNECVDIQ